MLPLVLSSRTLAFAFWCRTLTTVSAEADEEGDSSDARENRSGYFMIRGIMKTLTPTRRGRGLKQAKVNGNSRDYRILENGPFRAATLSVLSWTLLPRKRKTSGSGNYCGSLEFIMTRWRMGTAGALRMGLEHGAFCTDSTACADLLCLWRGASSPFVCSCWPDCSAQD